MNLKLHYDELRYLQIRTIRVIDLGYLDTAINIKKEELKDGIVEQRNIRTNKNNILYNIYFSTCLLKYDTYSNGMRSLVSTNVNHLLIP